ncbi:porin [Hydrogenophaga sp. BPS33]|uniref:porin n=1 Tax=Hydrogenophaga sp. BPS33 TaxID=2651974 RepID=UPI00135A85B1|nr:porin [Hydrogenophaga sp. BPS33]
MNKLLSSGALALLAAAPLTQAHAQSSVTLYGVVDTSLTRADNGNNGLWRLDSGAGWGSRLGFRGTEDLGGGLKANFVLEQGFDVSTGTLQQGGATFGRAAWLGLSGADWEARVGRQLSPMALSLLAVDPGVGNYWGNLQSTGIGSNSPNSVAGDAGHQATARINNSLLGRWTTGALTARLMLAPGESASPKGAGNYHGGSLTYQDSQWVATLGYSRFRQYAKDIPVTANADWQNELTFAASYNFGPVRLASGYYRFDPSEQNKVITATTLLKSESVWVGGTIPVNNGQILLQVIRAKSHRTAGVADGTATILGATYEHFLSKRTVVYVSGGIVKNNDTSNIALVGSTAAVAAAGLGADPKAVSFGIRHSF